MSVRVEPFGKAGDRQVTAYIITAEGAWLSLIDYGARLRECFIPDVAGRMADVALGFDRFEDYLERGGSTGAICGRYGNRIACAQFELGGKRYELSTNEPPNHLHGGFEQFAKRLWRGEALPSGNAVRFTLDSPDGDEGYPGNLHAEVTYALEAGPALRISMRATSDHETYVNLIFHGYWNLAGHAAGLVDGQLLRVAADCYLPVSPDKIPTGAFHSVAGTPFDFRQRKAIGAEIAAVAPGYDHNLCLGNYVPEQLRPVLRLADPGSGRAMTLSTDQPGVQFYTANQWARPVLAKGGASYAAHQGAAFETQAFPNTPNMPAFGQRPLRRGETYRHEMLFKFSALPPPEMAHFLEAPWR